MCLNCVLSSVGSDCLFTCLWHVVNVLATMADHNVWDVHKALHLALFAAAVSGVSVCMLTQAFLDLLQAIPVVCVQDTDRFCHQTLCDPSFVQYVTDNFLCWGGVVRMSDPFTVRRLKPLSNSAVLPMLHHHASNCCGCLTAFIGASWLPSSGFDCPVNLHPDAALPAVPAQGMPPVPPPPPSAAVFTALVAHIVQTGMYIHPHMHCLLTQHLLPVLPPL